LKPICGSRAVAFCIEGRAGGGLRAAGNRHGVHLTGAPGLSSIAGRVTHRNPPSPSERCLSRLPRNGGSRAGRETSPFDRPRPEERSGVDADLPISRTVVLC
jgi:hypothetical protein